MFFARRCGEGTCPDCLLGAGALEEFFGLGFVRVNTKGLTVLLDGLGLLTLLAEDQAELGVSLGVVRRQLDGPLKLLGGAILGLPVGQDQAQVVARHGGVGLGLNGLSHEHLGILKLARSGEQFAQFGEGPNVFRA
jgi:hypothetical protein